MSASDIAAARAGWPSRGGGARAIAARARVARLLWDARGERRAPSEKAFDAAVTALPRGELEWICEYSPLGPLYLLPTSAWLRALGKVLDGLGARRVLDVAAGDGFLARALGRVAPHLDVVASDSGAWERPEARMTAAERRAHRGRFVPGLRLGAGVMRLDATAAIRKLRPDVVLAAWLPPGPLLDEIVPAPARFVVEIGAAGATPGAWSWRFAHEFLDGPVETACRCRLDERPREQLHSTVTLYFGARHPEFAVEEPRRGDWLWHFRPTGYPSRR